MYCIFHLPRTGSHYLHSLINSSLSLLDSRHIDTQLEPFNPDFNTADDIQRKYQEFVNKEPQTTVKLVINHYQWLADKFINESGYKTIFIEPKNYRSRLLKALVEKQLKTYSNGSDRKQYREPLLGQLNFSDELIEERFIHYKLHMEYKNLCDYVFYDEFVFSNTKDVMELLGLPLVTPRYKRVAPYYTDLEMLDDVDKFNNQYDKISTDIFGKII